MKRRDLAFLLAMGAIIFVGTGGAKAAADAAAGKEKTRMCAGCHGIEDYRTAFPNVYSVPRLGGQDPGYIAKALESYRAGARKHPVMQAMAGQLSDADIADIAAYYSAATPQPHGKVDAAAGKKAESCAACHGPIDGKPVMPAAPKLAGQQYDYVVHALRDLRSGARASPIMGAVAKPLTDEDIRALARYYSTVPGLSSKH